ncbi:MAG: methylmalonyl Co-A mutase-associated GTPase MeaB, partial [bacterium]
MSKKRPDHPKPDPPPSALHVRRGVEARHDGLPDGSTSGGEDAGERNDDKSRKPLSTRELVTGVRAGDRTVLARAVTLVESNAPDHFDRAQEL